ncbi:MAG TPA: ABC transporter permease subunit [Actinomycetota bacterium]|nr:ABC transporter permease subunit [Actinomycetota bacterium]
MIRLTKVELRRLFKRRLFRVLLAALFLTVLAIIVVNGALSNRDLAGAHAKAQQEAQGFLTQRPPGLEQACGGSVTITPAPASASRDGPGPVLKGAGPCTIFAPSASDLYQDPRFSFADNGTHLVVAAIALVSILGFVIGTGFIGAEWTAGTFPLLLTWEPRRLRVLGSKLAALIITFVAIGVVTTVLLLFGGWLIAATRGTTAGITGAVKHHILMYSLRGLLLVVALTGAGAAIAGLTRHTAAALVGAVGYLVVFEIVVRRQHPEWIRWLLTTNAGALIGGWVHVDPVIRGPARFLSTPPPSVFVHADRAALFLGILLVVLVATWALVLLRRDIDESAR